METLSLILAGSLIALTFHSWSVTLLFIRTILTAKVERADNSELPKAAILMGLKGSDPDLQEGLQSLMRLDYPEYELFIVADSRSDSSWSTVEAAIRETNSKHVHLDEYIPDPKTGPVNSTNSKQMQSLQQLDDSFEIVAMADGDLMAHPGWLREMVTPLVRSEKTAATFGNRWFLPEGQLWGSLVRYIWNVGAVVSMYFLSMPWGGCFAIKRSVIRELGLVKKWSQIIAFDAATPGELKKAGLQIRFIPTMLIPNREECRLGFCLNFFQRQLLWTRLYHPGWPLIVIYAFFAGLIPLLSILTIALDFSTQNSSSGLMLGSFFIGYWVLHCLLFVLVQKSVERTLNNDLISGWMTFSKFICLILLYPITQLIQWLALIAAITCKSVSWRGLRMEINSPIDIRLVGESEERQPIQLTNSRESL